MSTSIAPYRAIEAAGQGYRVELQWIPPSRIPEDHRELVHGHAYQVAAALGLPVVHVRWFGPAVDRVDLSGYAPEPDLIPGGVAPGDLPLTIGINAAVRGDVVGWIVAHEVRHVAQRLGPVRRSQPEREADAERFADGYVGRIGATARGDARATFTVGRDLLAEGTAA